MDSMVADLVRGTRDASEVTAKLDAMSTQAFQELGTSTSDHSKDFSVEDLYFLMDAVSFNSGISKSSRDMEMKLKFMIKDLQEKTPDPEDSDENEDLDKKDAPDSEKDNKDTAKVC